jgi:hypothetical protein
MSRCSHRTKRCECFNDRKYWGQFVEEAGREEGLTLERMGEIFGTTRMGQSINVRNYMLKVRGIIDSMGYKREDFFN